jgi:prepilin-type N-terminal cleavage/methylation domain-containing protein
MNPKRGFTLIELLVVMAIIALLISLLLPALAKARANAKMLKDGSQIRGIHQGWVTYSQEFDGIFPTPGLIDRLADEDLGTEIPGRGPEDAAANNTANLHSACIGQNYYPPGICVGTTEPSAKVWVKEDYNYDMISPAQDQYWDDTFQADVGALGSNVSYASIPIAGDRKNKHWRNTLDSTFLALGNRGVEDGVYDDPNVYESSLTLQHHGGHKQWVGLCAAMDNHIETYNTFLPENLYYKDPNDPASNPLPDNIFASETGDGGATSAATGIDNYLVIVDRVIANQGQVFGMFTSWD